MTSRKRNKLRILLSGPLPPPVGGIGVFNELLLTSSLKECVDLRFVLTSSQTRPLADSGRLSFWNLLSALRDCVRFSVAVITSRPDICHMTTAFGLSFVKNSVCVAVARLAGSRVLLHPHCSFEVTYSDRPESWKRYFRTTVRLTHGIVALSHEWRKVSAILPDCPVYYLPNAVDLARYSDIALEHVRRGRRPEAFRVLYLGYLGKAKGTLDLIDAAAGLCGKHPDIFFDLVGGELRTGEMGPVKARIESLGLNDRVVVHPPVTGSAKTSFLREADLFVYPSHHEGMPIAVLEAMASGLAIVATRVGGLPDLLGEGVNGMLVDPEQPNQLASALEELYLNDGLRSSMMEKSRSIAHERYDLENRISQLVEIYRVTIGPGAHGSRCESSEGLIEPGGGPATQ